MKTSSTPATNHHLNKFSQTCNLLSLYLKENGSIRDLNLGLSSPIPQGLSTKNLLAMIEKSGKIQDLNIPPNEGKAEMTIFYNGQVIVFNEFSEDKAKEVMDLASQVSGAKQNSSEASLAKGLMSSQPLCEGDMPIMRNASLARFIAKRKDRIRAKAPYQVDNSEESSSSSPSTIADNTKAWLAL